MIYPKEFIAEAKRLFPDHTDLYKGLETGGTLCGRVIENAADIEVNPETIVGMLDVENFAELRQIAQRVIDLRSLYSQWQDLFFQQSQ